MNHAPNVLDEICYDDQTPNKNSVMSGQLKREKTVSD